MLDRRNGRIYVAGDGGISVINSRTGHVIHAIHIADAALNPVTGLIHAANGGFGPTGVIFVISVRTGRIIRRVHPGGRRRGEPRTHRSFPLTIAEHWNGSTWNIAWTPNA
jgi:DNA-binding beta-propeller fold protein YncE